MLSDSAKSDCERFIDNATDNERQAFYESENIEDLYQDQGQMPNPKPQRTHIKYMLEYLENEYNFPQ